jgi:hypothetical protein
MNARVMARYAGAPFESRSRRIVHFSLECPGCRQYSHAKLRQADDDPTPAAEVQQLSGVIPCEHCGKAVRVLVANGAVVCSSRI